MKNYIWVVYGQNAQLEWIPLSVRLTRDRARKLARAFRDLYPKTVVEKYFKEMK
jgi:hypothetical protein